MFEHAGVSLNGKHMYHEYGLYVKEYHIEPPEVNVQSVAIPGRNGSLDLTDVLTGEPTYRNREIRIALNGKKKEGEWTGFMSNFMNSYHGRKVEVVFDNDPGYFYRGRATIEADFLKGIEVASFTVRVDVEPFKYEQLDSTEEWIWDIFDLDNGIIREYGDIPVNGAAELVVYGSRMLSVPDIIVSTDMQVGFLGKTYNLVAGTNHLYDIVIRDGENLLEFTGTGTVSVRYRGGSL